MKLNNTCIYFVTLNKKKQLYTICKIRLYFSIIEISNKLKEQIFVQLEVAPSFKILIKNKTQKLPLKRNI